MISRYFFLFSVFLALAACANTPADSNNYVQQSRPFLPVEINVISDINGNLPEYPVNGDASHYRAYLQATNNDRYRIRVSNNTGQRVGVVIAVDGRNIISGQKSYLQNTERMYILNPLARANTKAGAAARIRSTAFILPSRPIPMPPPGAICRRWA